MAVDSPSYAGTCPKVLTFAATFTINQNASVTYHLEAGSSTPGFVFTLPGEQTTTYTPGTYTLSFPLSMTSSGSGWVLLHFTAPIDLSTNQVFFNLTCQ